MLRAYPPDRFKTAGVTVNIGAKGDIFVLTEEQHHELQEIHGRSLDAQVLRTQPQAVMNNSNEDTPAPVDQ